MKIIILAAMDKELELLKNILSDMQEEKDSDLRVFKGKVHNHDVILSKCGIGKVNAALNTLKLIRRFNPDLVINSGVAGGAGGLKVGEILVAGEVAYHDVWCGPGTVAGAADGFDRIFLPWKRIIEISREYIGKDEPDSGVSYGLIATGDIFISRPEEIQKIRAIFPGVAAVDMESAAIAQTCAAEKVRFNIIRVVSDTPGEEENISQYQNFWNEAPEKTFHVLEKILNHL